MPFKRKPRLPDFDYRGCHRYFVTICTDGKQLLFVDDTKVKKILDVLADESRKHGFVVWGYCFMPDHLHLLLEGEGIDADMKAFVKIFKQKTGYQHRKETTRITGRLWQPSYYDRVLRGDEDLQGALRYILNNPVRKGLVSHFADYRYLGSFAVDVRDIAF